MQKPLWKIPYANKRQKDQHKILKFININNEHTWKELK